MTFVLSDYPHLLDAIADDESLLEIINDRSFDRLQNISFLGAIPHSHFFEKCNVLSDRASHSLRVADLAAYSLKNYSISLERKRHLIAAALLHDIGHAPLSHSMEPILKDELGFGHHEAGFMVMSGKAEIGKDLKKSIDRWFSFSEIESLLDKTDFSSEADIFNREINVDTIDGITHSYFLASGGRKFKHSCYEIVDAAFDEENISVLDDFWSLKDKIYTKFILSKSGVLADKAAQFFLVKNKHFISEDFYFGDDSDVMLKCPDIFDAIYSCEDVNEEDFFFTQRKYFLSPSRDVKERYKSIKKSASWSEIKGEGDGEGFKFSLSELH